MKSIDKYISLSNEKISSVNDYISMLNERISSIDDYIQEKLFIKKSDYKDKHYFPTTINKLRNIIEKLVDEQSMKDIIDLNSIDTSEITDMTYLFNSMKGLLKIDVSDWDVSNVTSMNNMFRSCENLEKIIGIEDWNVSNVKNMQSMFRGCDAFNQDLSKWDVSNVTIHSCMFFYCPIEEKYKPKFK